MRLHEGSIPHSPSSQLWQHRRGRPLRQWLGQSMLVRLICGLPTCLSRLYAYHRWLAWGDAGQGTMCPEAKGMLNFVVARPVSLLSQDLKQSESWKSYLWAWSAYCYESVWLISALRGLTYSSFLITSHVSSQIFCVKNKNLSGLSINIY